MIGTHRKAVLGFWEGLPQVQKDLEKVSEVLQNLTARLPSSLVHTLREPLKHLLKRPGKGLRPALLLQAARFGGLEDRHYTLAAGLELLHLATLVHDDIVDGSPLRRGEPSFHAQKGISQGVLYGDLLFSLCFDLVGESSSPENSRHLARMVTFMAGAEIIQDQDRYTLPTSRRRILKRMTGKTGALFALSLFVGASESGIRGSDLDKYRRLGYHLGLAFQLQDDILDFEGPPELLGKPTLSDMIQGHYTLPVYLALKKDPTLAQDLLNLKNEPELSHSVYQKLLKHDALTLSRQLLDQRTRAIKTLLTQLPTSIETHHLPQVIERILGRKL